MIVLVYSHPHFPGGCFLGERSNVGHFCFSRLRVGDIETPPIVDFIVSLLHPFVYFTASPPLVLHVVVFQTCARTTRISQIEMTVAVFITKLSTAPTRSSCPKIGFMPASWKIVPGAVDYAKVGPFMTRGSTSTRIHLSCTPPPSVHIVQFIISNSYVGPFLFLPCGPLRLVLCRTIMMYFSYDASLSLGCFSFSLFLRPLLPLSLRRLADGRESSSLFPKALCGRNGGLLVFGFGATRSRWFLVLRDNSNVGCQYRLREQGSLW
jgi:hypothetical protein